MALKNFGSDFRVTELVRSRRVSCAFLAQSKAASLAEVAEGGRDGVLCSSLTPIKATLLLAGADETFDSLCLKSEGKCEMRKLQSYT